MNPPFGINWGVWLGVGVAVAIALIGGIWRFATWRGGLDQWKKDIDNWKGNTTEKIDKLNDTFLSRFDGLQKDFNALASDVKVIKSTYSKMKNGMFHHSPLVPSKKAVEILKDLGIITQIDANLSHIQNEVESRSKLTIYRDIKDPEERFIEISPAVIHELIKKGKIDEKKIDEAMERLAKVFTPNVASYYGVLLLISAYILEKGRIKGFVAKPSMIYSEIDAMASESVEDVLVSFGGDAGRAIESFERSVRSLEKMEDKGELARNKNKLALLYEYDGKLDKAEKEYIESIRINPDNPGVHNNLGVLLHDLERYDEAEKEYRESIRINPDDAEVHYNLGVLLQDLERYEEAEKECREAIRINPDLAEAHNNLGVLLKDLERYEEAEKELREAIRINPDYAKAHNNLGNLLKDLKRFKEAEKELREAIKINPDDAAAHNNLGALLDDLERFEEAEKEYREAIRINPDYVEVHYNLGVLLDDLERFKEAEKEYREAIKINPDLAEAHNNLGTLLDDLERYEEAEKEYREAIRINPDNPEAHANLGILFSKTERLEEAKEEFEIAKGLFKKQGREEDVKKVDGLGSLMADDAEA
jgi:tetratricopeptide (TPR) repeat protein